MRRLLFFALPLLLAVSCRVSASDTVYPDSEASAHVGETADVRGKVTDVKVTDSNTAFIDFGGKGSKTTFVAVIFSSALGLFDDVKQYNGAVVTVTGQIKDYKGKTEIILTDPSQIHVETPADPGAAAATATDAGQMASPSPSPDGGEMATPSPTPDAGAMATPAAAADSGQNAGSGSSPAVPASTVYPDGKERRIIP